MIDKFLAQTTIMTPSSHPEAFRAFAKLGEENGIHQMPELRTMPFLPGSNYIPGYDTITVADRIVESMKSGDTKRQAIAELAHELGHALRKDKGASKRKVEFETDSLAAQLIGEREPVAQNVLRHKEDFDLQQEAWKNGGRMGKVVAWMERRDLMKKYGTHEQRLANIRDTDPQDRTIVDRLIEQRNAETGMSR